MMKLKINLMLLLASTFIISCADGVVDKPADLENVEQNTEFDWVVDEFADIKVLRYQIPGWEDLSLKEQKLVYYLVQAGLSGRDIIWDQNYQHNLKIREALEKIYTSYEGDKTSEDWRPAVS